ncbi:1-aminocyclopropane-1-carboxylate deaminase/D-cysteine desulfhydrase [Arthrospiribacter ruber]|uniref:1-aminocyclopropane-1-carboxylate deaminase/D-cysteine desulfhydrase n=1 Tax=Arthrospiribacter ruber TaxID=2487934 RepID=A0A951ME80_9BACT|nr:pyridoxal-phosphate dependent enzyme [Arthrospiribacter ruber]MBW3469062.1 1-aminocyclopropane-1-carboxylate deaminase/D-cysteine desulfhydrase [Arthrospiribacter ruber]
MLIPAKVPTSEIIRPAFEDMGVRLYLKRLDRINELVSGNKFFKLKYNLEEARRQGKSTLLTFGGAFSNHIYATAAAAKQGGFECIGIIRGEETKPLNPTLQYAEDAGMRLHYISREEYRKKKQDQFLESLREKFGAFFLIPEGGTNSLAIKGAAEILGNEDEDFTHVTSSVGTGGTLAGLAKRIQPNQHLLGFSSLKGEFIHGEISELLDKFHIKPKGELTIVDNYHFGGYGKFQPELIEFIRKFHYLHQIPLDPVYTGKMMYGVIEMIKQGFFPKGSRILAIHTGGLQGIAGFNSRFNASLPSE